MIQRERLRRWSTRGALQKARTQMAPNTSPNSAEAMALNDFTQVAPVATVARRYWWATALVLLIVALMAGARYITAPRSYLAAQRVSVALVPAQELGDPGDPALAVSDANAVAHSIASSDLMTSSTFADAVLARLPAQTAQRESISKAAIERALWATDQEAQVWLQAKWSSEAGARAIVTAASLTLQQNPVVPDGALNPGDTISMQVAESPPTVRLDDAEQSANLATLAQEITIGLGIALLLPFVFAGLTRFRAQRARGEPVAP
jgi:hypothetical protein